MFGPLGSGATVVPSLNSFKGRLSLLLCLLELVRCAYTYGVYLGRAISRQNGFGILPRGTRQSGQPHLSYPPTHSPFRSGEGSWKAAVLLRAESYCIIDAEDARESGTTLVI